MNQLTKADGSMEALARKAMSLQLSVERSEKLLRARKVYDETDLFYWITFNFIIDLIEEPIFAWERKQAIRCCQKSIDNSLRILLLQKHQIDKTDNLITLIQYSTKFLPSELACELGQANYLRLIPKKPSSAMALEACYLAKVLYHEYVVPIL